MISSIYSFASFGLYADLGLPETVYDVTGLAELANLDCAFVPGEEAIVFAGLFLSSK